MCQGGRNWSKVQVGSQSLVARTRAPMEFDPQTRQPVQQSLAVEVLRSTGKLRLAARGYSMLPTLWPGDLLNIEATSFDRVSAGDVVLFCREDRFFIHRIVSRQDATGGSTRPSLVTRGDSMPTPDARVFPEELLGKVVSRQDGDRISILPGCGRVRRWLGLALAYGDRLRSVALRIHEWQRGDVQSNSELAAVENGSR